MQSLTSTLVAIAREFQAQRDSTLMDAWKAGGLFEGKPATDEMVLVHWKERLAGVAKNDPMWDAYNNLYMQYDYAIHESKMSVKYAQGKVSGTAMANFYLSWAKKIPKDSEFYRILQRDGAQLMKTEAAKSKAALAQAKEDAYNATQLSIQGKTSKPATYALDVLTEIAQQSGRVIGTSSSLMDMAAEDPGILMGLVSQITPEVYGGDVRSPSDQVISMGDNVVLYYDNQNHPVTRGEVVAAMTKLDPKGFDGSFDLSYVKGLMQKQLDGLQSGIDVATKTGHVADASSLQTQLNKTVLIVRQVDAVPVTAAYKVYHDTWASVRDHPGQYTVQQINDAWDKYVPQLLDLARDPRIAADNNLKNRLIAEAKGDTAAQTVAESLSGSTDPTTGSSTTSENAKNAAWVVTLQDHLDAATHVDANGFPDTVWTPGVFEYNQDTHTVDFNPQVGGPSIGQASKALVDSKAPGGAMTVWVPTGVGSGTMPISVLGIPVYGVATDANGNDVHKTTNIPIAWQVNFTSGGVPKTSYRTGDPANPATWVFWAEGTTPFNAPIIPPKPGDSSVMVDLSSTIPSAAVVAGMADGESVNGYTVHIAPTTGVTTITFDDPKAAALSTLSTGGAEGVNLLDTSPSLTIAANMGDEVGQQFLTVLSGVPQAVRAMQNEMVRASGGVFDPGTGDYVGGPGTNQQSLSASMQQLDNAVRSPTVTAFVAANQWYRPRPLDLYAPPNAAPSWGAPPSWGGARRQDGSIISPATQAQDAWKLRQDNRFGALAGSFFGLPQGGARSTVTGQEIKLGPSITLPTVPAMPSSTVIAPPVSTTAYPLKTSASAASPYAGALNLPQFALGTPSPGSRYYGKPLPLNG